MSRIVRRYRETLNNLDWYDLIDRDANDEVVGEESEPTRPVDTLTPQIAAALDRLADIIGDTSTRLDSIATIKTQADTLATTTFTTTGQRDTALRQIGDGISKACQALTDQYQRDRDLARVARRLVAHIQGQLTDPGE